MPHLKLIPAELVEVRRIRAAILAIRYVLAPIAEVCGHIHATVPCALCAPERHAASDVMYSTIVCSCELIDAAKPAQRCGSMGSTLPRESSRKESVCHLICEPYIASQFQQQRNSKQNLTTN